MPKESESLNHKENSNSKMLAIPPTPQVEEVLISDEEQPESDESQPYEARLNEKLRDLGLYEDGMTIQQKEELLAVVVASWQTAEEEKTRRQFYEDYVNASEAFCNDQIEFSFKESPECSNHTSLYNATSHYFDIPLPPGSPSDSFSKDTLTKSLTPNGDLSQSQTFTSDIASDSSLDNCDDANCTASSSGLFGTSDGKAQVRRGKGKRGRATKQSAGASGSQSTANIKRVKGSHYIDKLPKSESIEQSISSWKPCSSPKDIPLSSSKRPWLTEPEEPCDYTEEDLSHKMVDLMKDLDFARVTNFQRYPPDRTISKPYHLTRRGHFSKRNNRPDKTDIMVGVSSTKITNDKLFESKELYSRNYRYVPANRTRPNSSNNNFEAQTTRSGLKYGLYSNPNAVVLNSKETEQLMTLDETDDSKWPTSLEERDSPTHHLYSEVEVILDENLPKFNNLRPGLYGDGFSFMAEVSEQVNSVHKFEGVCEAKNLSVGGNSETINHNANSSFVDNDSSDGSSVIDVETVVDDEIEEFVLKRKMLQEYQCAEKEPNASQSKRLKKTSL